MITINQLIRVFHKICDWCMSSLEMKRFIFLKAKPKFEQTEKLSIDHVEVEIKENKHIKLVWDTLQIKYC